MHDVLPGGSVGGHHLLVQELEQGALEKLHDERGAKLRMAAGSHEARPEDCTVEWAGGRRS